MHKPLILAALILIAVVVAVPVYGTYRWNLLTQQLRTRLNAGRAPIQPATVSFAELRGLPTPVQKYFRAALTEGQPMLAGARLQHSGTFNMGESTDRWKRFTSHQQVVTQRPGFDWDGRIVMLPGVLVRVHDAYVVGEGILHASLLGLFSVADLHDTKDIAAGELMRFFAEAAWYPTALLPSQGVRWEMVDERSARGTLTEGPIEITMTFIFNQHHLIDSVRAEARGRTVKGEITPTPWAGRFWNYEKRQGMQIPIDGEVAWVLPEGPKPYWRGHIENLIYEQAP
jgi:hypothetical protein